MIRYLFSVLLVTLALVVMLHFNSYIGTKTPFLLFFAAVAVSAWVGGFGPGLIATLLSAIAAAYYFIPPVYSFRIGVVGTLQVAAFMIEGLLFSSISAFRTRAEEAVRREESRKAAILEISLDGIITIDHAGRLQEFNPAAERIFGLHRGDVVGRNIADTIIPPELRDLHRGGLERYLSTGVGVMIGRRIETRGVRSDGVEFPIEVTIARIPGSDPPFFTGTVRDITDRKRAEERLRFRAEAGRLLVSSLDVEATLSSVVRLAVPALADYCSVDLVKEDTVRRLAVAHVDPAKVDYVWELDRRYPARLDDSEGMAKVIRTGQSALYPEIPDSMLVAGARDEEHLTILRELDLRSGLVVPLKGHDRILGTLTLVYAESDRRYGPEDQVAAEDLAHTAALALDNAGLYTEIQRADRAKDEFLVMLGHELRNPLGVITNSLHVLRPEAGSAGIERAKVVIQRQTEHMSRLVGDLLDVGRISRRKVDLRRERMDLDQLIRSAVEDYHDLIARAGLTLRLELPDDPIWIDADPTRISQVIRNLLHNAVKFTPSGGEITIHVVTDGCRARVAVEDTGAGIEAEVLPQLFKPFTQAGETRDRSQGGLGLGLALVKGLVELHGGEVSASSPGRGCGSRFTFSLPVSGSKGGA